MDADGTSSKNLIRRDQALVNLAGWHRDSLAPVRRRSVRRRPGGGVRTGLGADVGRLDNDRKAPIDRVQHVQLSEPPDHDPVQRNRTTRPRRHRSGAQDRDP
ncbi:hypothetical protein GCM10009687_13300 [Asanoa iriomotensis]|uniref:Uncharacterized protein n=1 Tax=Asanoa iriomotensis TaxID=234613 RepID=A0ABQ4C9L0_9ACTN|nr:hypothetical protein Air01nite_52360 [Asanoa iriomotensis]